MDKIRSYHEALTYIYSKLPMYQRVGAIAYKKDLTNTLLLGAAAGNPQHQLKTIHIAGTNGKGTTTHIIAGGLQAQGYSVGVYTSPHYIDFRERIKINGTYISKEYIINFLNQYQNEIEYIQPSFFEVTVILAFSYFRDQKVDFAVIETGLGGRLDSTNIIHPILAVITNISFDHQNMLGNTLDAIATEKAGIIKSDIPVIIGEKQNETSNVFVNKSKELQSPLYFAEEEISLLPLPLLNNVLQSYNVMHHGLAWIEGIETDLIGPFQHRNLITGLSALLHLSRTIDIDTDKIKTFFPYLKSKTGYIGRWQILNQHPLIIADSAHNEGGLRLVLSELQSIKYRRLHIIAGFVNDKDLDSLLSLFPKHAKYYFAKANIPRGLDAKTLNKLAVKHQLDGKAYTSVRKAFAAARQSAKSDDLIYIGGSIFVVAEVL